MTLWMDRHTQRSYAALLEHEVDLDLDATVKTVMGGRKKRVLATTPRLGRPSHVYQAMLLSAAKVVLNVDVQAGNQMPSTYAQPTLWGWLDASEKKDWPTLLRGHCAR